MSGENLAPSVIQRISKEVAEIIKNPIEDLQLLTKDNDITDVQAIIVGPADTPYAGGHFRVKLVFGRNFPEQPPAGFFITKIFHPNVAANGEICVNTLKRDWSSDLGIKHILLTIKCLLIVPNPESALNEEAGRLLLEDYETYASRARIFTSIHAQSRQPPTSAVTKDLCATKDSEDAPNKARDPFTDTVNSSETKAHASKRGASDSTSHTSRRKKVPSSLKRL